MLALAVALVPARIAAQPVETGDFDGDGRLTIRDVFERRVEVPAAPGSLDGFLEYPCSSFGASRVTQYGAVKTEILRRGISDSLPHWYAFWPPGAGDGLPPLSVSDLVTVDVASVASSGGSVDDVKIGAWVTTFAPLRAFWLVLETDRDVDILRTPFDVSNNCCDHTPESDVFVGVHRSDFLITNGRFVIHYGFSFERVLPPGTYYVETMGRLRRGTPAGEYALRLHASSEILLEDGTVASPTPEAEGRIIVSRDVREGWDGGVPPIRFDRESRSVLGRVEFEVTDAEGFPGEEVKVKVRMRTETPLDVVDLFIPFRPGGVLTCDSRITNLFHDPAEETPYAPSDVDGVLVHGCVDANVGFAPYLMIDYRFDGFRSPTSHPRRSLEYFRPIREWTDLVEVSLTIDECTAGGTEIDFEIAAFDAIEAQGSQLYGEPPSFGPYEPEFPCGREHQPGFANWTHEYVMHPGKITVLGNQRACGEPPPDIGLQVVIGSASGAPGDVVEVPVFAAADIDVNVLTLAFEIDPEAIAIESAAMEVTSQHDFRNTVIGTTRGEGETFRECIEGADPECRTGVPYGLTYFEAEPRHVMLNQVVHAGDINLAYLGPEPREVVRLHVRIREDFTGTEATIRGATGVSVPDLQRDDVETGAYPPPGLSFFAPARSVESGIVRITGNGFRRGDANLDGLVDLSDAVAVLNFLFLGAAEPECRDGADTDDSGVLDLTDGIFLLNALFLGAEAVPAPWPGCGEDPTADGLGCARAECP